MGIFLRTFIKLVTGTEPAKQSSRHMGAFLRHKLTERDLIARESQVGAHLFGPVAAGHRREFFCLDAKTWIWHEEWLDAQGKRQQLTTRYEVQPHGILKIQDGQPYAMVEGQELQNLLESTRLYEEHVMQHVYKRDPQTGRPLALATDTL